MDPRWRPVTPDDVPAWNALLARAEAVDRTGEHYDEDDLREELTDAGSGPEDRVALFDADTMIAYSGIRVRGDLAEKVHVHAEGTVDPAHRGLGWGTEGVAWQLERTAEIQARRGRDLPCEFRTVGMPDQEDQVAVFTAAGLTAVNWSASMRVMLDADEAFGPACWTDGVTLHTYEPAWCEPMRLAHNAAFQDHWGFVDWTEEMWEQWVSGSRNFRPALSWVVVDDSAPDVVVGYVQTNEYEAYEAATGRSEAYLAKIGVRREHRGRGIASALLRHALHSYRDAGFAESALDVDTNNPTGAYGLYERAGYHVDVRSATYQRLLPALDAQAGSGSSVRSTTSA